MNKLKKSFDPSQYLISLPEYRKDPTTGEWLEKEAQYLPVSALPAAGRQNRLVPLRTSQPDHPDQAH